MHRDAPKTIGGDILIFIGIAFMAFIAVHSLGLFQSSSGPPPLRSLQELPSALASRIVSPSLESAGEWLRTTSVSAGPPSSGSYRVEAGDTLSLIAMQHEIELSALIDRNEFENPDRLEVGQLLTIPGSAGAELEPEAEAGRPGLFAALEPSLRSWLWSAEVEEADSAATPADAQAQQAVDELLVMAEEELRAARFEEAVHSAKAAERLVQASSDANAMAAQRARIEVVRATVHSAFGSNEEAYRSLERALDANPELQLDPASSPRKLVRALEATQERRLASAQRLGSN